MSTKPTVGELEIQLKDLVRNWESFARQLPGLEDSALEEIKYNKRDDVKSQKAALYGKWLEVYPNASWDDAIAALHKAEENTIAKHVQEWLSSVDRQMSLSPKQPQAIEVPEVHPSGTEVNTSIQQEYEVPESIVDELEDLHETFVPLATEVNSKLQEAVDNGKVSVKSLASYVQLQFIGPSHFSRVPPTSSVNNAEQILQSVQQHYTFLNPNFILNMATFFLVSYPITKQAEAYKTRIATFKKNVKVRSLKNELGQFNKHHKKSSNNLILKILVTNAWGKQSIKLVQTLLLTLFPIVDPDELPWYSVCAGSLLLSFIATSHMILPLIVSCARKMEFMRHLGIISVTIGNILIRVDNEGTEDDDELTFEHSLLQATASDHIEAVRFLLKYVKVNVNVMDTKDMFLLKFYRELLQHRTEKKTIHEFNLCVSRLKDVRDNILRQATSKVDPFSSSVTNESDIREFLQEIEYHVLNTTHSMNRLSHLPNPFKQKLAHTYTYVNNAKLSAKIGHLHKFLQSAPALNYTTQVTITLSKVWSECSVEGIEMLLTFLFPHTAIDELYWFRVKESKKTLKIKLLIIPKPVRFTFDHFSAKVFGVIKTQINNNTIFDRRKMNCYTFEKGIRQAKGHNKLLDFLKNVSKYPCKLHKQILEPDHNNNFQMVPDFDATPLMIACCNSNGQLVQLLLEHGADLSIKTISDSNTCTALLCSTNSSKLFQMLLDHGAKLNFNELIHACYSNNVKVVDILLNNNYPHIDTKDVRGYTPLCTACSQGYTDIVKRLLKAKADSSIPNYVGETALTIASAGGHLPVVEILLVKAKMNPNVIDAKGTTPLWIASSEGHAEVVECLLRAQADPNIPDNNGVTPISIASSEGHAEVVECLLHAKVDPNTRSINGV